MEISNGKSGSEGMSTIGVKLEDVGNVCGVCKWCSGVLVYKHGIECITASIAAKKENVIRCRYNPPEFRFPMQLSGFPSVLPVETCRCFDARTQWELDEAARQATEERVGVGEYHLPGESLVIANEMINALVRDNQKNPCFTEACAELAEIEVNGKTASVAVSIIIVEDEDGEEAEDRDDDNNSNESEDGNEDGDGEYTECGCIACTRARAIREERQAKENNCGTCECTDADRAACVTNDDSELQKEQEVI
jgi:hypothetical protein